MPLDAPGWETLTVRVRAEVLQALRAAAAREGQPPEAQAALWLEEHAAEVAAARLAADTSPPPRP